MGRIAALSHDLQDYLQKEFGTKLIEGAIYDALDSLNETLVNLIFQNITQGMPAKSQKDPVKIRQDAERILDDEISNSIVKDIFIRPKDSTLKLMVRKLQGDLDYALAAKPVPPSEIPFSEQEDDPYLEKIVKKYITTDLIGSVEKEIINDMGRTGSIKKIALIHEVQEKIRVIAAKIAAS